MKLNLFVKFLHVLATDVDIVALVIMDFIVRVPTKTSMDARLRNVSISYDKGLAIKVNNKTMIVDPYTSKKAIKTFIVNS